MTPVIAAPWLLVLHDTGEGGGVKARPTDQGAVDVGLRHERVDVLRLDAAAVEDAHPLRGGGRSEAHQLPARWMSVPAISGRTASSAVKGGAITTSRPRTRPTLLASALASATASPRAPCIFQLPAMSGVRLIAAPPHARPGRRPRARPARAARAPRGTRAPPRRRSRRG